MRSTTPENETEKTVGKGAAKTIGVGIIGSGKIALANHVPGVGLCANARITALCDSNPQLLKEAGTHVPGAALCPDFHELLRRDDVQAVIISTPNFLHAEIALAAIAAGKHVLCEKPIAMNLAESRHMYQAAEAAKVRHMAAFTYRFVPAMRYMHHLVTDGAIGRPYHFRANRFQDWGDRGLGWRQTRKLAGTGEMGDMLSHRIDYGHLLIGPIQRLAADWRIFVPHRGGKPADVDDWIAILARFKHDVSGVLESSKLTTGRGEGAGSQDYCEVNGEAGSLVFYLQKPLELLRGKKGGASLETVPVPREFQTWPGSPRDPADGDPLVTFRWDQDVEFITAISEDRPCRPSFREGCQVQAVMDTAAAAAEEGLWLDVPQVD